MADVSRIRNLNMYEKLTAQKPNVLHIADFNFVSEILRVYLYRPGRVKILFLNELFIPNALDNFTTSKFTSRNIIANAITAQLHVVCLQIFKHFYFCLQSYIRMLNLFKSDDCFVFTPSSRDRIKKLAAS